MKTAFSLSRTAGLILISSVALLLVSCSEKEVILPGVREDIRPADPDAIARETGNTSRSIRLAAQTSNKDWAQSIGTQSHRTAHPALRAQPQRIWSAAIGAGNSRRQRITADPVVAGGRIYTLDASARVSAVSPTGALLWSTDLTPSTDKDDQATGGGMAYADGTLYVSSGFGWMTALNATNGALLWQQKLNATGSGTPTVYGGLVYLVAGDDTGWVINPKDGRIVWQIEATPSISNVLGAPAPALSSEYAIFAFGSGDLVATFRRGGLRRWDASVSGRRIGRTASRIGDVTGSPVIVGNRVYAGNHSGRIVAFALDTGERLWTAREGALSPVWPAGDSIFAVSDRNQLLRINAGDGSIIWAVDLPGFVKDKPRKRGAVYAQYGPVLAGGRLIVPSSDGQIRLFSPEDGHLTGTVEIPGGASTGPVIAGNTLYIVSAKGDLHAFR